MSDTMQKRQQDAHRWAQLRQRAAEIRRATQQQQQDSTDGSKDSKHAIPTHSKKETVVQQKSEMSSSEVLQPVPEDAVLQPSSTLKKPASKRVSIALIIVVVVIVLVLAVAAFLYVKRFKAKRAERAEKVEQVSKLSKQSLLLPTTTGSSQPLKLEEDEKEKWAAEKRAMMQQMSAMNQKMAEASTYIKTLRQNELQAQRIAQNAQKEIQHLKHEFEKIEVQKKDVQPVETPRIQEIQEIDPESFIPDCSNIEKMG